jgi:ribosomal protein L7/L12
VAGRGEWGLRGGEWASDVTAAADGSTIAVMSSDSSDRLVRLERKVDFLFQRMGIDPNEALLANDGFANDGFASSSYDSSTAPPGLPSSFQDALSQGKLIEAIKIYRSATGAGLREAKQAVEAMARSQGFMK